MWEKIFGAFWLPHEKSQPGSFIPAPCLPLQPAHCPTPQPLLTQGRTVPPWGNRNSDDAAPLAAAPPGQKPPLFLSLTWWAPAPLRAAAHLNLGSLLALSVRLPESVHLTQVSTDSSDKGPRLPGSTPSNHLGQTSQ